jgi:hypothetical protein
MRASKFSKKSSKTSQAEDKVNVDKHLKFIQFPDISKSISP